MRGRRPAVRILIPLAALALAACGEASYELAHTLAEPEGARSQGTFGRSLDRDGGTVADLEARDEGAVYVFERGSDGEWAEAARLVASDADLNDHFGEHVALSGDRAPAAEL